MKKLVIIPLLALILCGCNEKPTLINDNSNKDTVEITEYKKYEDLIEPEYDDNGEVIYNQEKLNFIKSLPLLDISIKQAGQTPEIVQIRKNENPYFLVADTSYANVDNLLYSEIYTGSKTTSKKYADVINKFKEKGWELNYCITDGGIDKLTFEHDEYNIANYESGMFNLEYDSEIYTGSKTTSKKYADVINKFKEKGWELNYCITDGGIDKLTFEHDEYNIANYESGMFNLEYDNVSLISQNIPLAVTLYMNEGKVSSIYINYYLLSNQKRQLSVKDINMLRDSLELSGISDFDIVINSLQDQISNYKKLKADYQQFTLKSIDTIPTNNDISFGTFIINIK